MSRRGFGSVRKRRSGRWEARYTHPDTGDVYYRYFIAKADAEEFLSITHAELLRGDWLDPNQGAKPVKVWAEDWYQSLRKPRPRTLATYRTAIDKHIVPHLGELPIARLSSELVDTWVRDLEAAGVRTARCGQWRAAHRPPRCCRSSPLSEGGSGPTRLTSRTPGSDLWVAVA